MSELICPCGAPNQVGDNFCGVCGGRLEAGAAISGPDLVWGRGEDDFAVSIPADGMRPGAGGEVVVRHGAKALFFEDGRLVEVAESGRYTTREGGFINRLFNKEQYPSLSAVLVDAGDVSLAFTIPELRSRDGLFVQVGLEVVVRLADPNAFFVNLMKQKPAFKLHDLRAMLFGEIRNALQEGVGNCDFSDLDSNIATKNTLASRMEAHLRQTFKRGGLDFGQVRALTIRQKEMDATSRAAAEAEMKAREVETGSRGKTRIGEVEVEAGHREAELIGKRLEVYRKLKEADVEQIKTDEEFRKFRQEIDRDQVLDEAEWQGFKDEILWRDEDRQRDRRFLLQKVDLQQNHDLKRLELLNRADLAVEDKRRELGVLEVETEIAKRAAERDLAVDEVRRLGDKGIAVQARMKELELEKREFEQAMTREKEQAAARAEVARVDLEITRLRSEMGISNLERIKAIKRQDQVERDLHALKMRREEIEAIKGLSLEEMIVAAPDGEKATILRDLAQSRELKGMGAEEILALKDPAALGRALEERARHTMSDETKALYDKMLGQSDLVMGRMEAAYRDSAERAERMSGDALRSMSGQMQDRVNGERQMTERTERLGTGAMAGMAEVAGSRAMADGLAGIYATAQVCGKCKHTVPAEKNFCPNCGEKAY